MESVSCDTPQSAPTMNTTYPCVFRMPRGRQHHAEKEQKSRSCFLMERDRNAGFPQSQGIRFTSVKQWVYWMLFSLHKTSKKNQHGTGIAKKKDPAGRHVVERADKPRGKARRSAGQTLALTESSVLSPPDSQVPTEFTFQERRPAGIK